MTVVKMRATGDVDLRDVDVAYAPAEVAAKTEKKEGRMRAVISKGLEQTLKAMSASTGKAITDLLDELVTCAINRRAAAKRWSDKDRAKGKAKKRKAGK